MFNFFCPDSTDIVSLILKAKKKKFYPGPEKIYYPSMAAADSWGKMLPFLFSTIITHGNASDHWIKGKTVLIPKAGDLNFADAANWGPITLLNTVLSVCLEPSCKKRIRIYYQFIYFFYYRKFL